MVNETADVPYSCAVPTCTYNWLGFRTKEGLMNHYRTTNDAAHAPYAQQLRRSLFDVAKGR